MSDEIESAQPDHVRPSTEGHVLGPRKRIVAREVQSASLSALEPTELADLGSTIEVDPPILRMRPEPLVLDPTTRLGERRRKHGHKWGYRFTGAAALLTFLCASGSIGLLLMGRLTSAAVVAFAAALFAVAAFWLSRTSELASRLRGYAIVGMILSAVALAINVVGGSIHAMLTEIKTKVSRPR